MSPSPVCSDSDTMGDWQEEHSSTNLCKVITFVRELCNLAQSELKKLCGFHATQNSDKQLSSYQLPVRETVDSILKDLDDRILSLNSGMYLRVVVKLLPIPALKGGNITSSRARRSLITVTCPVVSPRLVG